MSDHLFKTEVIEFGKVEYHEPLVFGGFVGPGLAGLVCAGYIIEKLDLHEVAHVRSQHIPPVAVFVGAKLRHPFRIYSNGQGTVIVTISEMPLDIEGLYEISAVLVDWFERIHAKEIVVLDGIGVSGIPEDREAFSVADERRIGELEKRGIKPIPSALISGVGGSILNQCLTRRMSGVSILTPSSIDFPDPGAPLTIIESLNRAYNLQIPTSELQQNVEKMNERLNELAEQYKQLQGQVQGTDKARPYG